MLALAVCLALSAPEVFAASQSYDDPSRVAADMASAQSTQPAQNVQPVSQTTQPAAQKPQKQKKLKESDIIKQ